ncbi:MAG: biotin-dependent carboxyltransferase family protein [Hyphomonas sp.]
MSDMGLTVLKPGVQATLQAAPRRGVRHLGIPASGPADPISMALANRLVGNFSDTCALELPFGLAEFEFEADCAIAITGAFARLERGGAEATMHETLQVKAGERVSIGAPESGARVYMAVTGGFVANNFLGSVSTCLPAGFGGLSGRALRRGDRLETFAGKDVAALKTPPELRQTLSHTYAVRCVPGPDAGMIPDLSAVQEYTATRRADRTGIEVMGPWPELQHGSLKPSAPVFPGAVQLTPSGTAFVLLPDSQTTGGYPHVLQVIEADCHLLGQIRPGDRIRFIRRTPDQAAEDLRRKTEFVRNWLPDFRF